MATWHRHGCTWARLPSIGLGFGSEARIRARRHVKQRILVRGREPTRASFQFTANVRVWRFTCRWSNQTIAPPANGAAPPQRGRRQSVPCTAAGVGMNHGYLDQAQLSDHVLALGLFLAVCLRAIHGTIAQLHLTSACRGRGGATSSSHWQAGRAPHGSMSRRENWVRKG